MANRKRRTAITAPRERWVLLGHLLEVRRQELGHTYRNTFERPSGINRRMQADFESAAKDRINHFMPGSFGLVAKGYRVTEESMMAVLRGEGGELTPAAPDPEPVPASRLLPAAPSGQVNEGLVYPRAWPIWRRIVQLEARGNLDPSAADLGLSGRDASTWESTAGTGMPQYDRAWNVADMAYRRAARNPGSQSRADGA